MVKSISWLMLLLFISTPAFATTSTSPSTLFQESQSTQILDRANGAAFSAGVPASAQPQAEAVATLTVLGTPMQAMQATATPPTTIDGVSYAEFYSFGKRVFSQSGYINVTGPLSASVGLAPTEVRVPLFVYPIGPLLLEVDGGARFQANVSAQIIPTLIITNLNQSTADITLTGNATAAGFVEAYAKLLFIRGGLGGQLDLIDGQANVAAVIYFDGQTNPKVQVNGQVTFLNGGFYGFIDLYDIFKLGWERIWTKWLYSWNGYCYSTGNLTCPAS